MAIIMGKNSATNEGGLISFLKSTYDTVTGDLPVVGSAEDLANDYLKSHKNPHSAVDSLIKWQCTKTATSGFITGFGGFITMPVAIPADMAQSWYVQLRMAAAIAHIYGHDIHSDQLKTFCILCLCGKSAQNILSEVCKKAGESLAKKAIKNISKEVLKAINTAVGCQLVTKAGKKSVVNLTKMVPVVSTVIGGTINVVGTMAVGKTAKKCFKDCYEERMGWNTSNSY